MSTETTAAPAEVPDAFATLFGGVTSEVVYGKYLTDRFNDLWDAVRLENPEPPITAGSVQMLRQRGDCYLAMASRLQGLCKDLLDEAGNAEYVRDQFTDALKEAVDLRVHLKPQEHRGPYVPGGVYRETLVDFELLEDQLFIDLADFEDVDHLPRHLTAVYSGSSNGQDFDLDLQFDLVRVSEPRDGYPHGEAVYSVTEV